MRTVSIVWPAAVRRTITLLSRPALIAYEKGSRTPGPTILYRLAEALGVDVLELTSATLHTATLTDLRARAGFTKTGLAAELGLRPHTYDRIERGVREPEPKLVPRLATALGVSRRTRRRPPTFPTAGALRAAAGPTRRQPTPRTR